MAKAFGGGMAGNAQALPMIMSALSGANSSAQQSGSPLLAALAPLASAMIGGRAQQMDEKRNYVSGQQALNQLAGGAATQRARDLLSVLSSGDLPGPLESIASTMLRQELRLPGASGTGRGASRSSAPRAGGASSAAGGSRPRLYGQYEIDGFMFGRTASGEMMPFLDGEGNPVPAPQRRGSAATAPATVPLPSAAQAAPAIDPNDPLGLFSLPPA
ncbi:MAG: hypothetical protein LCH92_08115 [Proteobacteria bacterium]|nr:hypothetical protein [Pseudomonadota bacterium]